MSDHADTNHENEALRIRSFLWRLRGGAIVHDDEIERAIERLDDLVKNYAALAARCDALEREHAIQGKRLDAVRLERDTLERQRDQARARSDALENALREIGKFAASHDRTDHHEILLQALYHIAEEAELALAATDTTREEWAKPDDYRTNDAFDAKGCIISKPEDFPPAGERQET